MPAMVCLTWLAFVGATAIDLELKGIAGGSIVNADISAQLFAMINLMLSPDLAVALSVVVVLLLLTFLITSADSGILIINTLASGGSQSQKGRCSYRDLGLYFRAADWRIAQCWRHGCSAFRHDRGGLTLLDRNGFNGHRPDQGNGQRRYCPITISGQAYGSPPSVMASGTLPNTYSGATISRWPVSSNGSEKYPSAYSPWVYPNKACNFGSKFFAKAGGQDRY